MRKNKTKIIRRIRCLNYNFKKEEKLCLRYWCRNQISKRKLQWLIVEIKMKGILKMKQVLETNSEIFITIKY